MYEKCHKCHHEDVESYEEPCNDCVHIRGDTDHFEPKISLITINAKLDKIMEKLGI